MHPKLISPEQLAQILSEKFITKFWSKIKVGSPDECWLWTMALDSGGYGHVRAGNTVMKAHRVAWMIHNKCVVPEGKDLLHSCIATRTCCNPNHLRPGTDLENRKDTINQGRAVYVHVQGSEHGRSKLTEADVLKIRELWAAGGIRQRELGVMFGVCREMISYVVTRKNWTHI